MAHVRPAVRFFLLLFFFADLFFIVRRRFSWMISFSFGIFAISFFYDA